MSGAPRFPGREMLLGGVSYTAAPLSLGAVKRLLPRIEAYAGLGFTEQLEVGIGVLHASMARNHPDLTVEQLEELVDTANVQELFTGVLKISGFEPTKAEAGNAGGPLDGTGPTSTPTSPPVSAGHSSTSTTA